MKMREWVRATYLALKERPAAERTHHFTQAQVESVMQMGIQTLIEALIAGDELRLNDLGRMWVEDIPARQVVSNLSHEPHKYSLNARRMARFRASSRLASKLNQDADDHAAERETHLGIETWDRQNRSNIPHPSSNP
jgi:nucleoid DNA-binding protein